MRISDWSSDVCSSDLIRVLAEFGVIEATVERRVEQRAGRLDRHTADAVHRRHAAGPAGVDEPALDAALRNALFQQIAIDRRVARPEGGAEAGRSDERRVGKEGGSPCRYRWAPVH